MYISKYIDTVHILIERYPSLWSTEFFVEALSLSPRLGATRPAGALSGGGAMRNGLC